MKQDGYRCDRFQVGMQVFYLYYMKLYNKVVWEKVLSPSDFYST